MKFFTKSKICKKIKNNNKKNLLFTQSIPPPKKKFLNKTRTKKNKTKRTHKENAGVPLVTLLTFVAFPNLLLHILYFLTLTFVVQFSPSIYILQQAQFLEFDYELFRILQRTKDASKQMDRHLESNFPGKNILNLIHSI